LFSVTIDYNLDKRKLSNKFNKYLISFGLYGLGGIVIITVFSLMQGSISEIAILPILLLGAVPGLIYFHISLLLTTLLKRLAN
jgi:VIT1/CCC1 family predicted Fe2+/Mn2+ transporter